MPVYLEYVGYSVELPDGDTTVGRDSTCNLRFQDINVSRRHVRFTRTGDEVVVEDLGSTNGTRVNGITIDGPLRLKDHDLIEVGGRRLRFRIADDLDSTSTRRVAQFADLAKILEPRHPRTILTTIERIERRRQPRRPVEMRLSYTSPAREIEAATRDLSLSGVFVCAKVFDPVGTTCSLTLRMDGRAPLRVTGIVRRIVDNPTVDQVIGLGIEFEEIGTYEKSWLVQAMQQIAALASERKIGESV